MEANSYKCPNCSASLTFDPATQMLTCAFCESAFTIEYMENLAAEEAARAEGNTSSSNENNQPVDKLDFAEPEISADNWEEYGVSSIICNSCGAGLITDENTAATFCAFCGSPSIIRKRVDHENRPASLIPFKITKENALDIFFKWCKSGRLTPRDFVSPENVEKITGLYVPFWLFDYIAQFKMMATGVKVASVTTGSKVITTTSHYRLNRHREASWANLPRDGSSKIDDHLMSLIEPFKIEEQVPFDMKYLSGFFADKYDVSADDLFPDVDSKIGEYLESLISDSCKGYTRIVRKQLNRDLVSRKATYAMLPVWFLNYKYRGKDFAFVINGQTGKQAGDLPVSPLKLLIIAILVLIGSSILFRLLGYFLLGGSTV